MYGDDHVALLSFTDQILRIQKLTRLLFPALSSQAIIPRVESFQAHPLARSCTACLFLQNRSLMAGW